MACNVFSTSKAHRMCVAMVQVQEGSADKPAGMARKDLETSAIASASSTDKPSDEPTSPSWALPCDVLEPRAPGMPTDCDLPSSLVWKNLGTTASESASSAEKPAVMLQHQAVGTTSMLTLNCPICERVLCATDDLAFFYRNNKQDGTEVHLMLKPEKTVPKTFQPSAKLEPGAVHSWSCDCGAKLGDTRHVGPGKAPMTAFKSASASV